MARMAASEYGADWVINNDADEFWLPNKSTIRETLSSLSDDINVVVAFERIWCISELTKVSNHFI